MMTESDIKGDLRDLFYIQENVYHLVLESDIPHKKKTKMLDNIQQKQVILTKVIKYFNTPHNAE